MFSESLEIEVVKNQEDIFLTLSAFAVKPPKGFGKSAKSNKFYCIYPRHGNIRKVCDWYMGLLFTVSAI